MLKGNFKTTFECEARCFLGEENSGDISLASISNLNQIIPESTLQNSSLLPFAGNLAVINMANLNGDLIATDTAIRIYKQFTNCLVDLEHNRKRIIGNLAAAQFSRFDEDYKLGDGSEILTEDDVRDTSLPFNLCVAGVIYKSVSENIVDKIVKSTDPESKDYMKIALSWEMSFANYYILLGSSIQNGKIITEDDEIEKYSKYLKINKGKGKLKDGTPVNRLIYGEDVTPLGAACTLSPAAAVAGLTIPEEALEIYSEEKEAKASFEVATEIIETIIPPEVTLTSSNLDNKENNTINSSLLNNDFVNPNTDIELSSLLKTNKIMSIKFLESFAALEALPQEELANVSVANLRSVLSDKIREVSEKWDGEAKAKDKEASIALARAEEAEKQTKEAAKQLETLAKQLEEVKKAQELSETNASFQLRMSGLDSKYNLDDKDRSVIAKNIKGLDDVGFSDYLKDCEVIFASKDKKKMEEDADKAKKDKEAKDKMDANKSKADDDDTEAKKKKAAKMKEEAKAAKELAEAAFSNASIEFDNLQNNISVEISLADKFKNAFSKENVLVKHKGR